MSQTSKVFVAGFQCILTLAASLLPYVAQIQTIRAYDKPPTPEDCGCGSTSAIQISGLAPQFSEGAVGLSRADLFRAICARPGSANAMAVVHDSGEIGLIPEIPLGKDGKLGKLKRIFGTWAASPLPFEMKLAAMGGKVSVKTPDGGNATITFNETTKMAIARFKGIVNGRSVSSSATVPIAQYGNYWFESSRALLSFSALNSNLRILPDYSFLGASASATPRAVPGTTILGSTEGAKLAQLGWLLTKTAGITTGIIAGGLALGTTAPILGSVAGFGSAILGIYDLINFMQPPQPGGILDPAFSALETEDELWFVDVAEELLKSLTGKASIAGSNKTIGAIADVLNRYMEKPSHALTNGMILKIIYTWPSDQRDLDTATTFLGQTVGYGCGTTSTYMSWTGDDTGSGGKEEVTCRISEAAENAALPGTFSITAKAGWYTPAGGSGGANLEMYLQNPVTGTLYGPRYQLPISPGNQSGCASTPVGSASFQWTPSTTRISWSFD